MLVLPVVPIGATLTLVQSLLVERAHAEGVSEAELEVMLGKPLKDFRK